MDARKRRLLLAGLGTIVLLGSWVVAFALPAPQQCRSIDCGANFNPHQVTWQPLSFWNWSQLTAVAFVLVVFGTMILLALLSTVRRR